MKAESKNKETKSRYLGIHFAALASLPCCRESPYNLGGGENGPVTVPAFKAGDSALRESNGGFDSHTLPPDSPKYPMINNWGEVARSFKATMYLMWTPTADSRCTGSGCTIPVPLGTLSASPKGWIFMGDTINTLSSQQGANQTTWMLNFNGQLPEPNFQASQLSEAPNNGYPTWANLASYNMNFFGCP